MYNAMSRVKHTGKFNFILMYKLTLVKDNTRRNINLTSFTCRCRLVCREASSWPPPPKMNQERS